MLLANGLTRSMHFTALSTVSFADIGKDDITLAAMAVHAGQLATAPAGCPAYHFAFGVLAVVTLGSVIGMALLPGGAGAISSRANKRGCRLEPKRETRNTCDNVICR